MSIKSQAGLADELFQVWNLRGRRAANETRRGGPG